MWPFIPSNAFGMEAPNDPHQPSSAVVSPFANTSASMVPSTKDRRRVAAWVAAILLALGTGGIAVSQYLRNPYRTLEVFPIGKYLESHRSLLGAKFKMDLRVEADLGWKDGVGRLMLFSGTEDSRVVAVMIPASLSTVYFTKGQTYLAELEVKEGGLIYANSCKKN